MRYILVINYVIYMLELSSENNMSQKYNKLLDLWIKMHKLGDNDLRWSFINSEAPVENEIGIVIGIQDVDDGCKQKLIYNHREFIKDQKVLTDRGLCLKYGLYFFVITSESKLSKRESELINKGVQIVTVYENDLLKDYF